MLGCCLQQPLLPPLLPSPLLPPLVLGLQQQKPDGRWTLFG
jgi:hypothetical protein